MEYSVADPVTGIPFHFQAKPDNLKGVPGFRIISQTGPSFFIANKYGVWRCLDYPQIDLELLKSIGLAIEEVH